MSDGVLNQVSFEIESQWGTAVVPDKSIPVHFGGGISTDIDLRTLNNVKAIISKNQGTYLGNRTHSGEYELDLFTGYTAYWVKCAMGAVNSAAHSPETLLYDHVITESVTKPSMTVEQKFGEIIQRFAGSIPSGFKLSIKPGETAMMSFPTMAKSQATATAITASYESIRPLNFADFSIEIDGSPVGEVASIELEYKNNIQFTHTLAGSNDASYKSVKGSELSGKIELYLDNTTLAEFNDYIAKTAKQLEIIGTGESYSSVADYGFNLLMHNGIYRKNEIKLADDYNLLSLEFEAIHDDGEDEMFNVTFTNALANLD